MTRRQLSFCGHSLDPKRSDEMSKYSHFRLLAMALYLCTVYGATKADAQQQYQFVPGSRQAVKVDPNQQQQQQLGPNSFHYSGGGVLLHRPGEVPTNYYQTNPAYQGGQPTTQNRQRQELGRQQGRQQPYQLMPTQQPQGQVRQMPQSGQPKQANKGYDFTDAVSVDGGKRPYHVHIPAGYDRTKPTPVVLVFHGIGMTGQMMVPVTGFNGLSDRNNFVVVYGDGVGHRWQDGRRGNADDIAYVSAILTKLPTMVNVDSRRVYAAGLSNGGFFTQLLSCALSDKIAAAGVVASTMMDNAGSQCTSARPVPIAFFLGTEDPLIPWGDGRVKDIGKLGEALGLGSLGSIDSGLARYGGLLNVKEMLDFWIGHNHCSAQPRTTYEADIDPSDGTKVRKETYGSGSNEVILYAIEGGGHTWPGCLAFPKMTGRITRDIVASDLLWAFFSSHSR